MVKYVEELASAGQTDDTGKVKKNILNWLPARPDLGPPIPPTASKPEQGWAHPQTARMLCPYDMIDDFYADPQKFCEDAQSGKRYIHGGTFPLFCYNEEKMDPDNPESGLFEGPLLFASLRSIYTGDRNTSNKTIGVLKHGKKGIALKGEIPKMTKITEEAIGYAACHARFGLCEKERWCSQDGTFNTDLLFLEVVSVIRTGRESWRDNLFKVWNTWVFGAANGANVVVPKPPVPGFKSGADKIRKWREEQEEKERQEAARRRRAKRMRLEDPRPPRASSTEATPPESPGSRTPPSSRHPQTTPSRPPTSRPDRSQAASQADRSQASRSQATSSQTRTPQHPPPRRPKPRPVGPRPIPTPSPAPSPAPSAPPSGLTLVPSIQHSRPSSRAPSEDLYFPPQASSSSGKQPHESESTYRKRKAAQMLNEDDE
ncbi:hypothetical protein EIP86_011530 [Pleurotus ostreatoroseus]|nr:hypothetical protein EIP86_011530 [Pleurotus ostreatoroseus]